MQSVQRLWGEKFIKVWYNKSHAAGRFPYNDKTRECIWQTESSFWWVH